jgi:predicted RNA-binding protein with PUA-like domain
MVQVAFVEKFARVVPLEVLKADPKLAGMPLLQKGQRLSVQQVDAAHFKRVVALGRAKK